MECSVHIRVENLARLCIWLTFIHPTNKAYDTGLARTAAVIVVPTGICLLFVGEYDGCVSINEDHFQQC